MPVLLYLKFLYYLYYYSPQPTLKLCVLVLFVVSSRLLMAGEIYVVAGDTNSNDNAIQRNVVSIIPHNKFNKQTFDNDIAVLKVRDV